MSDPHTTIHLVHALGSPVARVIALCERIGRTGADAVLLGESGTGKETFARLVHAHGPRPDRPFLVVSCAGAGDGVLLAILDGQGRFLPGLEGTVFLEDVDALSLAAQARLVHAAASADLAAARPVRLLAASEADLLGAVAAGRFRRDLYDLLACQVHLPPLRDRRGDVLPIFDRCFEPLAAGRILSPDARAALKRAGWPGNVREVAAFARRLAASAPEAIIGDRQVEWELLAGSPGFAAWALPAEQHAAADGDETSESWRLSTAGEPVTLPPEDGRSVNLREIMNKLELTMISWALGKTGGNKAAAAELLGLRRTTLVEKLRRNQMRAA